MYAIVQNLQQQLQKQTVRLTQLTEQLQQEIAQRQQMEASLQESEERFCVTFEQAAVGMAHVGVEGQFLRVNQKLCEMFGYTREELLKQTFQTITDRDHLDANLNYTRQVLAGEIKTYSMEKRYIRKDGTLLWVNLTVSLAQELSTEPNYFVVVVTDISNVNNELYLRQQTEEALRESEQTFRQLAENIHQVLFVYPIDYSQLIYISPAYEQIWGYSCESLYQNPHSWLDTIHPEDCDRVHEVLQQQPEGKQFNQEYRIIRPDGEIRWIFARTFILLNEEGQAYRVIGVAEDITERKLAEQELKKSRQFIQRIADASPNILYIYDLVEQRNIYVNREITQILGYTPTEIEAMGSSVLPTLMHPDDFAKVPENLERIHASADGEIVKWEYRMRCANGEWRWIYSHETVFTRTAEGGVHQIIGTAEDISDRKRAEEQIRASLAEKEVLLREIHHRVKNNLNVIHSLLNMQVHTVQDTVTKNLLLDSQKRLQTMALIHEQLYQSQSLAKIDFAEYIHRLANNLFAAANLKHDLIKLEIQADSVDLNLETAIPCGLIINELLTNAVKYAFPEGRSGIIRIEFYRDRDESLHLVISDNGVGIPPDSNLYKKASLGMRLVKILVQQLRATLEISGNQGASFHLSFIQIT